MTTGISKESLIKEFSDSVKNGKASFFIGSGISRKANYVGWKDVLRDCAQDIGLDVEKESDLITLAEYYVRDNQRTKITETIKTFFADKNGDVQEVHKIIASLPINSIWTTNYDTLIERAFDSLKITSTIITDDKSYRNIDRTAKVKIHKIHGSIKDSDKCIIARSDYEKFYQTHNIVLSELKGEMCSNSFLFLGYSFSDTDIQHILTRIRLSYDNAHPQRHFSIVERIKQKDGESNEDFEYRNNLQLHKISDMQRYGINVLLVDSYDEIEDILLSIRNSVYANNILFSGAYDSTDPLAKNRLSPVAERIAFEAIQRDFKIYTGYGKNLGADIVNGAYDGCTKAKPNAKCFNDNVFLFPFPYKQRNTKYRQELYRGIRKQMTSLTQIIVIVSGRINAKNSSGVYEEYLLAKEKNHIIIPIATTGGTARQIWDELDKIDEYHNNSYFQKLDKETTIDEIVKTVFDLIQDIRGQ